MSSVNKFYNRMTAGSSPKPNFRGLGLSGLHDRRALYAADPVRTLASAGMWAITRTLLFAAVAFPGYHFAPRLTGDTNRFSAWSTILAHGHWPTDTSWQYPPGTALVLLLQSWLPWRYGTSQAVVMLVADAVITTLIVRRAQRTGVWDGVIVYLLGTFLLGPMLFSRGDLVPAMLVVAGLALAARPILAGFLVGLGAAVKVWPVASLPFLSGQHGWVRSAAGAVTGAFLALGSVAVALGSLGLSSDRFGLDAFGHNAGRRGLQVEAVAATPWMVRRAEGSPGVVVGHRYGSTEILGSSANSTLAVLSGLSATVIVGSIFVGWWLRHRRPDADGSLLALAVAMCLLLASKVLSPQYLIWILGIAGLALTRRDIPLRWASGLLILIAALTSMIYPENYDELARGASFPTLVLVIRNSLLVVATALIAWRAWVCAREPTLDNTAEQAHEAAECNENAAALLARGPRPAAKSIGSGPAL